MKNKNMLFNENIGITFSDSKDLNNPVHFWIVVKVFSIFSENIFSCENQLSATKRKEKGVCKKEK